MILKTKTDFSKIIIYQYDNTLQTLNLIFTGETIPKDLKHGKKIWTGIDKRRKIKTIILSN